MSEETTLQQM